MKAPPPGARAWFWSLVLVATIAGAGLRLFRLGEGNFWVDELYTVRSASNLARGQWQWTKVLGYVPAYLGLTTAGVDAAALETEHPGGWLDAGVTERIVRLPSALIGIATIPILALASRRVLGWRAAGILAVLLALSPWHLYWSQAARYYVPQFLFYNLALILYIGGTRPADPMRLAGAAAAFVVAFMIQPTALVLGGVIAADWAVCALRRRPLCVGRSGWAAATTAAAACAGLSLADALRGADNLATALSNDLMLSPAGLIAAAAYQIWPAVAAFAALSGLWLWTRRPRLAAVLGAGAVLPIIAFAGLSTVAPVGSRYAFVCLFCWLALAAIGADRAWRALLPRTGPALAAAPAAVLAVGSLLGCAIYFNSEGNFHARWGDAARAVAALRAPGEPVHAAKPGPWYIVSYYLREPVRDMPASTEEVAAIPGVSWFLIDHKSRGSRRHWLMQDAELMDYFALRAVHTNSSVQIYRHEAPPLPDDHTD